jgi:hypothetical protein
MASPQHISTIVLGGMQFSFEWNILSAGIITKGLIDVAGTLVIKKSNILISL